MVYGCPLDTMEWTRLANLNQNRSQAGCALYGKDLVIAGGWGLINGPGTGGLDQIAPVKTVESYDITSGTLISL